MATAIHTGEAVRAATQETRVRQAVRIWEFAIGRLAVETGEARLKARTLARAAYALMVDRVQEAGRLVVVGDWAYEPTPCGAEVFIFPWF